MPRYLIGLLSSQRRNRPRASFKLNPRRLVEEILEDRIVIAESSPGFFFLDNSVCVNKVVSAVAGPPPLFIYVHPFTKGIRIRSRWVVVRNQAGNPTIQYSLDFLIFDAGFHQMFFYSILQGRFKCGLKVYQGMSVVSFLKVVISRQNKFIDN